MSRIHSSVWQEISKLKWTWNWCVLSHHIETYWDQFDVVCFQEASNPSNRQTHQLKNEPSKKSRKWSCALLWPSAFPLLCILSFCGVVTPNASAGVWHFWLFWSFSTI
jgi:hypothetical protein